MLAVNTQRRPFRCQITHDTVVVKDGGSSAGVMIALVALVIVLAGAWYFVMGPGAGTYDRADRHQRQRGAAERRPGGVLTD